MIGSNAAGSFSSRVTQNGVPGPAFPTQSVEFMRSDGALALASIGQGQTLWTPSKVTMYYGGGIITSLDLRNVVAFSANYAVPHMLGYGGIYIEFKSITTGLPTNCHPYSSFIREDGEIATLVEQNGKLALYQLSPVPETSSILSLLLGIVAFMVLRRKSTGGLSLSRLCYTTVSVLVASMCCATPTACKPIWNTVPVVRDSLVSMPARNLLVCDSEDGLLVINPRHRNVVWRIGDYVSGSVSDVAGTKFIGKLSSDYQPVVYDVDNFATVFSPSGPQLYQARLSTDGKVMAAISSNKAYIYSVIQKQLIKSFTIGAADWIIPNHDGSLVYSGLSNGVLELYDVATATKIGSKSLFSSNFADLSLSLDGQHLVALSRNGWLVDVAPNSVNVNRTLRANTGSNNRDLNISSDSRYVAVSGDGIGTTIYALSSFDVVNSFKSIGSHSVSAFINGDRDIVMTMYSGSVYSPYIGSVQKAAPVTPFLFIPKFVFPSNYGSTFAFSPDGGSMLMNWPGSHSSPTDFGTLLIDSFSGLGDFAVSGLTSYEQLSAKIQPNGKQYITGGSDWRIRAYHDNDPNTVQELAVHGGNIRRLCYDSTGNKFAAVSDDNLVSIWNAKTLSLQTIIQTQDFEWQPDLTFSRDGQYLYLVKNNTLRKYDAIIGTPIWSWTNASRCILSPDEKNIAVGGISPSILNCLDGSLVSTFQTTSGSVAQGALGSFLLSDNGTTVIEQRSYSTGSLLGQITLQRGPSARYGLRYGYNTLGSDDGRLIFSAGNGNAMYRNPSYPTGMTCRAIVDIDQYYGPFTRFKADIQFLNPATGQVAHSISGIEDSFGDYRANVEAPRGIFDIRIKCGTGLSKIIKGVDFAAGTEVLEVQLTNGDIDGDNYVGTDDYLLLSAAFDSKPNDADWLAAADLDGDDYVGTNDYLILSHAFDTYGD